MGFSRRQHKNYSNTNIWQISSNLLRWAGEITPVPDFSRVTGVSPRGVRSLSSARKYTCVQYLVKGLSLSRWENTDFHCAAVGSRRAEARGIAGQPASRVRPSDPIDALPARPSLQVGQASACRPAISPSLQVGQASACRPAAAWPAGILCSWRLPRSTSAT